VGSYDNTTSLHANAYDEAITTPTADSVCRAPCRTAHALFYVGGQQRRNM
jgi:methylmalonyl-CoA mutase N-terminal domain/subunit